MVRAVVLFSNGLDSRLVLKIMKEQISNKNLIVLFIKLPFIKDVEKESKEFCEKEGVQFKVIDFTKGKKLQEYLEVIRCPRYKRGRALNPCIDCRVFMLKKAKEFADKNNIELVVTGEVINQRPASQKKNSLDIIENDSGLKGRLLRPLSAKILNETFAEKKGLIDRNKFFSINGRQRKTQINLAKKFGLQVVGSGGGCLLTDVNYSNRLKKILNKKIGEFEIKLSKFGRHFEKSEIVLGRDKNENNMLKKIFMKYKKGYLIIPKQPGPSAWFKSKKYENKAKELIQKYSKHKIEDFYFH